jgi:hypothetical protein
MSVLGGVMESLLVSAHYERANLEQLPGQAFLRGEKARTAWV